MTGILTLDSLVAILVALGMITASIYLVSIQEVSGDEYQYQLASDILAVAEKTGALDYAARGNSYELEKLQVSIPATVCFGLEIQDREENLVFSSRDTACPTTPEKYIQTRRTFVSNSHFYIATMRVWPK